MIENVVPSALPAMRASRQLNGGIDFTVINRLHVPVALVSMVLLLGMIALALRRPRFADLGPLATTAALAILGNAAVCGVLANPHDRYGARVAWLATLVVVVAAWRLASRLSAPPRPVG
jgi:Na+/proline symporter